LAIREKWAGRGRREEMDRLEESKDVTRTPEEHSTLTVGCGRTRKYGAIAKHSTCRVAQKSKPLPNDPKIVLNCIKACQ